MTVTTMTFQHVNAFDALMAQAGAAVGNRPEFGGDPVRDRCDGRAAHREGTARLGRPVRSDPTFLCR